MSRIALHAFNSISPVPYFICLYATYFFPLLLCLGFSYMDVSVLDNLFLSIVLFSLEHGLNYLPI